MALNPHRVPPWNPEADTGGELPAAAYAREVAELPQEDRRMLARTVGPAVKYAAFGVFLHFLLWLLTPLAEFALAQCSEEGEEGIVQAPLDFLTLVGYLIFFAPLHLYSQCKCMQYVIIPQLDVTQRFRFLDIPIYRHISYWTWLCTFSALTCGATLNTLTNGQILGRTMATYACGAPYRAIEVRWQLIMDEAIWHQIPGFAESSFLRISIFLYAVQLVTPIFAWIYARPRQHHYIDYHIRQGAETTYRTLYNSTPTNHGAVLMVLGSLARFEAVTFQDVTFATEKMTALFQDDAAEWQRQCLVLARTELDRAIARFMIIGLLQDVIQTNLQTTVVGIDWYVASSNRQQSQALFGGLDLQMFFSVILCFLSTIADIPDAVDVIKIAVDIYRRFPRSENWRLEHEDRRLLKHVKRKLYRFSGYVTIFIFFSIWSFAKLVALFACDKHLWNFHPTQLLFDASFEMGCA